MLHETTTTLPLFLVQERAVLYARVSGDDRKYATSGIEGQLRDCQKYAQEKGYRVVGEFYETPDKQTSGYDWLSELDKILKLAEQEAFDVLIVREVDRLARNRFKQMSIENRLEMLNLRVEYVIGQYEDTSEGRLLKGLMGEFAEYERSKILERTARGRVRAVEKGNITTGGCKAPYGYDTAEVNGRRTLVINEQEAAVVHLIFDLYVNQRHSLHSIAGYLDNHYVPKPAKGNNHKKLTHKKNPKGWELSTLNGILSNESYIGRWYYGKTKSVRNPKTGKRQRVARPKSEWLMVEVPPIVNEKIFEVAQIRREANKRQMGKNRKHNYLLGGMARCGHCGKGASGITTTIKKDKKWSYYKCNTYHSPKRYGFKCENSVLFRAEAVDNAIWQWIKSILLDPDNLDETLADYEEQQFNAKRPLIQMIEANQAKLVELHEQKDRLVKGYTAGVLSLDDIAREKVDLDKQIENLIKATQDLEVELGPQKLTQGDKEKIKEYAAKVRKGADLADDNFEAKREIFELLQVQASLIFEDGQRWADVTCILGEQHLPTDNNISIVTTPTNL